MKIFLSSNSILYAVMRPFGWLGASQLTRSWEALSAYTTGLLSPSGAEIKKRSTLHLVPAYKHHLKAVETLSLTTGRLWNWNHTRWEKLSCMIKKTKNVSCREHQHQSWYQGQNKDHGQGWQNRGDSMGLCPSTFLGGPGHLTFTYRILLKYV